MQSIHCQCNYGPQEDFYDEEDETWHGEIIKTTNEILAIIYQQKSLMKRNNVPFKFIKQLEAVIFGNPFSSCSKEKKVTNYFK